MNNPQPTLVLTVGLPRSGKSTWAQKQNIPMVNPDSIRLALHGQPFVAEAEPMVWAMAKYMVRALFLAGHPVVILDATNLTRRRRGEWNSKDWCTRYKVFNTDAGECAQRAVDNNQEYLLPVISRMNAEMEPLSVEERLRLYEVL